MTQNSQNSVILKFSPHPRAKERERERDDFLEKHSYEKYTSLFSFIQSIIIVFHFSNVSVFEKIKVFLCMGGEEKTPCGRARWRR